MADLKAMFGKKAEPAPAVQEEKKVAIQSTSSNPFARKTSEAGQPTATQTDTPQAQDQNDDGVVQQPAAPRPTLAGLRFAKVPGVTPNTGLAVNLAANSGSDAPRSTAGGNADSSETSQPVRASSIDSLDDLSNFDLADVLPARSLGFADEVPATAPTRELPAELEKTQKQFVDLMDGVYSIVHDPDLLGNVIKSIMIELKANPSLMKLVAPDDVRTWVHGMRDSMGLARIKKQEAKSKRSGGAGAKKSNKVDSDMLADLDSILGVE